MKKILLFAFFVSLSFSVHAQFLGTPIGPEVAELNGKKLQWEAGSYDYFVMFKSLIENNIRTLCDNVTEENSFGCDWATNPEGDTCLAESTFVLDSSHVPPDAYVEAAYLVWSGALDPSKFHLPPSNTATLSFSSSDGSISLSENITAPRQGILGVEGNPGVQDFTFEGIGIETAAGSGTLNAGFYTYRVDVSSFFQEIHEKGRESGVTSDGYAILGNYTVSNVDCSNDPRYISRRTATAIISSGVIGGWSLITVYRSTRVEPKMVYIYNGFAAYQFQEQDIAISGFEFPDKPTVKVTLHVLEGDPGISIATDQACGGGGFFGGPCPPEGLSVTGQTTPGTEWVILQNDCNPAMFKDMQGSAFNFSETYNSISSLYGWEDTFPKCVGGDPNNPNPDTLEYTMDVDTFIMSSENDPMFDYHFKKGDDTMYFKVGANGDFIFSNFMVASVDTKAPRYDIPPNINTPNGREKHYCSCSNEADSVCFTAPFYFAVKIENWGDDLSTNVTIQDNLPPQVSYVSGTTEMCKDWKSPNVCEKWIAVDDKNGEFPLKTPYPVADIMGYCDKDTNECPDSFMFRFKVAPNPGLAKHEVIENTALISDDSGLVYKTNTSIPLRLVSGSCPSTAECENPDLTECGGIPGEGCTSNDECEDGEICNSQGKCETDTSKFTNNAEILISKGKNNPSNSSSIFIPAPSENLVAGQFSILGKDDSDKFFTFNALNLGVKKDNKVNLSSLKLIYDENGDGKHSEGEPVIAEVSTITGDTISFPVKKGNTVYKANVLHHFIIVTDATYSTPEDIPMNNEFNFFIEIADSFDIKDAGKPDKKMDPAPMDFVKFSFEPSSESFIFTKGPVEPSVPDLSDMNKENSVMHIRTKAVGHQNSIEKIRIKTMPRSVLFKDGIKSIKIYLDKNGDGNYSSEDLLATATPKETATNLDVSLLPYISYNKDEEKFLVVVCDFKIPDDAMAQIEISNGRVSLSDNKVNVLGTPLQSKEYWFKCEDGDLSCQDIKDEKGCSITTVESSGSSMILIMLLLALTGLFYQYKDKKRTAK
jgi:hypothetical protein